MEELAVVNKQKIKRKFNFNLWKKIAIFLAFQLLFGAVSGALLTFYGPFEKVKKTIVGMSWNTLNHQWVARIFLSDEAISKLVWDSRAIDPTSQGGELTVLNFKENHSDKIEYFNINSANFEGKMLVIADPTRVVTGYSSKIPKSGETTSAIAKKNGAIAAINAGGFEDEKSDQKWVGTGGVPMGFIIKGGKFFYGQAENADETRETAAFTDKGVLIVGTHSDNQLKKYNIKEGISFGPPLIVNGKPTITSGDGGWGIAPRSAIGQKEDGSVIFLVIDGRTLKYLGATLREVQDILLKYGAVNAVNLDGGSSTTLFYDGKVINKPSDSLGERTVPSVFMVMPEKVGASK